MIQHLLNQYLLLQQRYNLAQSMLDRALENGDDHFAAKYLNYVDQFEQQRNGVYELIYLWDMELRNHHGN